MRGRNRPLGVQTSGRRQFVRRLQGHDLSQANSSQSSRVTSWLKWLPRVFRGRENAAAAAAAAANREPPSYEELFNVDESEDNFEGIENNDSGSDRSGGGDSGGGDNGGGGGSGGGGDPPAPTPNPTPKREAYIKKLEISIGGAPLDSLIVEETQLDVVMSYMRQQMTNNTFTDSPFDSGIDIRRFRKDTAIYAFDLTPDMSANRAFVFPSTRSGLLRIEVREL
jgi:hypothetical protein